MAQPGPFRPQCPQVLVLPITPKGAWVTVQRGQGGPASVVAGGTCPGPAWRRAGSHGQTRPGGGGGRRPPPCPQPAALMLPCPLPHRGCARGRCCSWPALCPAEGPLSLVRPWVWLPCTGHSFLPRLQASAGGTPRGSLLGPPSSFPGLGGRAALPCLPPFAHSLLSWPPVSGPGGRGERMEGGHGVRLTRAWAGGRGVLRLRPCPGAAWERP